LEKKKYDMDPGLDPEPGKKTKQNLKKGCGVINRSASRLQVVSPEPGSCDMGGGSR